jgi:hypothetical protein
MVSLVASLAALAPHAAWACTVCGLGQEQTEWAYVAMTAVLSLLPLGLIGGIGLWLHRRSAAAVAAQGQERG